MTRFVRTRLVLAVRDLEVSTRTSVPQSKPWGMREFGIQTPDGHRMQFGTPLQLVT